MTHSVRIQGVTKRNTKFVKWLTERLEPFGSQAELARKLGTTDPMVGKWKSGTHVIPFCKAVKIARHFNVEPKMLFELDEQEEYLQVLHLLHPTYKVLTEEDLYLDPAHARVHGKLQELLARSYQELAAIELVVDAFLGFPTTK